MKKLIGPIARRIATKVVDKSDSFEASYHPMKKEIISVDSSIPTQDNVPKVIIHDSTKTFSIEFGEERNFVDGHVRVIHNNIHYTSSNIIQENEKSLKLLKYEKANSDSPLGNANFHSFEWEIPDTGINFQTGIYQFKDGQYLVFETNILSDIMGCNTGKRSEPGIQFPVFKNESPLKRTITFQDKPFSKTENNIGEYRNGPICLLDDAANNVIISALNDFATNLITCKNREENPSHIYSHAYFKLGISGKIEKIPANYTAHFIMVFNDGINKNFRLWGDLLHQYYNIKTRMKDPYEHIMNSHLGYFTDAGSYYYYNPIDGMKFDGTLIEIEKYYSEKEKVPFQYYHLDSWWYPKSKKSSKLNSIRHRFSGGGTAGGCISWDPWDEVWDKKPSEILDQLNGKKFTAHARWYDGNNVYKQRHEMIDENGWSMPTTLDFWREIMQSAVDNNIIVFEQDWTFNQYDHFTHLQSVVGEHEKWLSQMHEAAKEKDIHIQYCMGTTAQWCEAVKYENVINFRTTRDYKSYMSMRQYLPHFSQNSMLANAIGVWPFLDVFFASRGQTDMWFPEKTPHIKALLNSLGGGPIAPGDKIGDLEPDLIWRLCRKDGLLLKPDRSLSAVDLMYVPNSTYYLSSTESSHDGNTWHYVLAYNIYPKQVRDNAYCLKDIDIINEDGFVEYNWFNKTVTPLKDDTKLDYTLKKDECTYCIYAPVLSNGMALIGDVSKYIAISQKEFSNIKVSDNSMHFDVEYAEGDKLEIKIYSKNQPQDVVVNEKSLDSGNWNYAESILSINLEMNISGISKFQIL